MFEPTWTWPNFTFSQLFIWIGANNDQMSSYRLDEWFWAMFEPTWTWPNFTFGQLFIWIGANNDQIWLPMGYFHEWFWAMFKPTWMWPNFTFGQLFMWIGANNDLTWRLILRVLCCSELYQKANLADIQSSRFWWYSFVFEITQSRLVSRLVNILMWIGTNNDQIYIWLPIRARWVILNNVQRF